MAVIRVNKTKDYTVISNRHLRDKNLSFKAKGILSLMLSLPDDWDYSIAGLEMFASDGSSATRSALKELETYGYLTRRPIRNNGRIVDWEYNIFENSQHEIPLVENQQVEKAAQQSKEKEIIKRQNNAAYLEDIFLLDMGACNDLVDFSQNWEVVYRERVMAKDGVVVPEEYKNVFVTDELIKVISELGVKVDRNTFYTILSRVYQMFYRKEKPTSLKSYVKAFLNDNSGKIDKVNRIGEN